MARALALLLGSFALLNLIGGVFNPGFDSNGLWIDLRPLPDLLVSGLLVVAALSLLYFGFSSAPADWMRKLTAAELVILLLGSLLDAVQFFQLQRAHAIAAHLPLPLSLFVAGALAFLLVAVLRPAAPVVVLHWRTVGTVFLGSLIAFPLAQMFFFGKTDYRRRADAIVVFGARTVRRWHAFSGAG